LIVTKPITAKSLLWPIDKQPKWTNGWADKVLQKRILPYEWSEICDSINETEGGDCFLANRIASEQRSMRREVQTFSDLTGGNSLLFQKGGKEPLIIFF